MKPRWHKVKMTFSDMGREGWMKPVDDKIILFDGTHFQIISKDVYDDHIQTKGVVVGECLNLKRHQEIDVTFKSIQDKQHRQNMRQKVLKEHSRVVNG